MSEYFNTTKLQLLSAPQRFVGLAVDSSIEIVDFTQNEVNYLKGPFQHNLTCGSDCCSQVLIEGWTAERLKQPEHDLNRISPESRFVFVDLIVPCPTT